MQDIPEWLKAALAEPTMSVPAAGRAVGGLSRNGSYAAAARGDLPTIVIGTRIRVPTSWVRQVLRLDEPAAPVAAPPASHATSAA